MVSIQGKKVRKITLSLFLILISFSLIYQNYVIISFFFILFYDILLSKRNIILFSLKHTYFLLFSIFVLKLIGSWGIGEEITFTNGIKIYPVAFLDSFSLVAKILGWQYIANRLLYDLIPTNLLNKKNNLIHITLLSLHYTQIVLKEMKTRKVKDIINSLENIEVNRVENINLGVSSSIEKIFTMFLGILLLVCGIVLDRFYFARF